MTIGSIINIATSGLYASQSGLKTVSQNIANVNTKGYVRIEQEQSAYSANGTVGGVSVSSLRRAANEFFQAASISANSRASGEAIKSDYLTQIQSVFGDGWWTIDNLRKLSIVNYQLSIVLCVDPNDLRKV